MAETLTTALERQAETPKAKNVLDMIDRMRPEFAKVLPATITAERFARVALTELRRVPKLYECEPLSLLGALMQAVQLGLEPGPLGHFYLVPFKREVVPIIGYKGMIELAYRSGQLKRIETAIVREGDAFDFRKGTRAYLDHSPAGAPGEREWQAVYAVAELKSGGKPFEVLYPEDVAKRQAKSPNAEAPSSPWQTDTAAMWRKSAVRALQPWLPQTPPLARAVALDETPVDAESFEEELSDA